MEVERTIEFILDQQAKFWAGLEEMRSREAEHETFTLRLAQHQLELTQNVDRMQQDLGAMMRALAEEQVRLAEEHRRLAEVQTRLTEEQRLLTESQRHTDGRLDALIAVVDGVVRRPPPR